MKQQTDGTTLDITIDAPGRISQVRTDESGKTLSITDFGANTISSTGAITTTYTYNTKGQTTRETLSNGDYKQHTYDARDNLTKTVWYYKSGVIERYTTYAYNSDNQQTGYTDYDAHGKIIYSESYDYDIFGKQTEVWVSRTGEAKTTGKPIHYTYDLLDRIAKIDYSAIADTSKDEPTALTYAYNAKGQLTDIVATLKTGNTTRDARLRTYTYDPFGKVDTTTDYYAFAKGSNAHILHTYTYDRQDRTTQMTYTDSASTGIKESFTYSYDKNSNITSERHINNWQTPKLDETRTYSYDAQGRLTKSVKTNNLKTADKLTTEYQFDLVGNRRYETENGIRTESKYNGLNQLIISQGGNPATTSQYTYDANGNQVTAKVGNNAITTYLYDTENRMTKAIKGTQTINTNTYRSDGQRITKRDKSATTTNYFYQGGIVLYTTDAKDSKTTHNLLGGSDNVIASKRYTSTQANCYVTYNKDIRTSTTTLTDDTGTYLTAYTYSDYGETARLGDTTLANEIAYTGSIYDAETELYYLNARYYAPSDGVFMTQDTYRGKNREPYSGHLYAYCLGNPIAHTDPTGHYSAGKAKTYAKNWWNRYNTGQYYYYEYMNDCANFGSQILVAGGIKKKKGTGKKNYADPTRWYAGTGGGSRAWEQAHYLYKYLTEKKKFGKKIMTRSQALRTNTKSGYVEYWKDAEVGDIIFWMRADGKVGHTTFVTFSTPLTNKAETGTRLAAHTGSHYKAYFSYFWKNLSWKKAIRVHPERD